MILPVDLGQAVLAKGCYHLLDLFVREVRVHGQAQYFPVNGFRDRQAAFFNMKALVSLLQVRRNEIVTYPLAKARGLQSV